MAENKSRRLPSREGEQSHDEKYYMDIVESLMDRIEALENQKKELDSESSLEELDVKTAILHSETSDTDIRPDQRIKVISLAPCELNLHTAEFGKGRKYTFNKFKEVKNIRYDDLTDIIENNRTFLENGYFVILDRRIIDLYDLNDAYEHILTEENIDEILNENYSDASKILENANDKQKEIIAELFVKKLVNNEPVNLNFIDQISRLVEYDIKAHADNIKQTLKDYQNTTSQ